MTLQPNTPQSLFELAPGYSEAASYTAVLLTQGKHRFYTLAMPSEVLANSCLVDLRSKNPREGFQRVLDVHRAEDIAAYIDSGFGTIPSSIILSAQAEAELQYVRKTRTLKFKITPRSFLIIDGQHRVYGFSIAKSTLRVPVVIYSGLTRAEECRLFMDVNTKQRPVPNELLLDIKRLAETETDVEALLREVFDALNQEGDSPLFGLMSPFERKRGRISRVTFNAAAKKILPVFAGSEGSEIYRVLAAYLHACLSGLRTHEAEDKITNPTLFSAFMMLFPNIAERVSDKTGGHFTAENFSTILDPMFNRIKSADLRKPGPSPRQLFESMRRASTSTFTISRA